MNNILIFGDSITWGAVDSKGGWANRLKDESGENTVYILGISGDTSSGVLKRLTQESLARLDDDLQTVLIIAIGINDSQIELETNTNKISLENFYDNLKKIVIDGKKFANKTTLLGLTPVDEEKVKPMPWKETHGYTNEQIEKYDKTIKKVAEEENVDLVEIYSKFKQVDYKNLLFDGLHPNDKGHELIYSLLKNYLPKH